MKKTKQKILSVCLALGMLIQCAVPSFAAENTGTAASPKAAAEETWSEEGRNRVDFCDGWKFQFGDSSEAPGQETFDDSSWETVNVPHTWNNLDAQDGGSDYKRGAGWYRKEFQWKSEYEGKRIFIEFQGSALETTVYVNGEKQGTPHKGGYTAFRYDITDSLKKGTNVIAVKSDNTWTESIIPLSGDFSVFGGIYREVSLVVTDFVHVDLEDHGSGGLYLQTENVSDASAGLTVRSTIVNDSDQAQEVTVTAVLKKPDSFEEIEEIPEPIFNVEDMVAAPGEGPVATLTETFVLKAGEEREFSEETVVSNPHLWNGLEDPFRYQVDLTVEVDGKVVDEVSDYVGFRYFRVDKNTGFYLNGKKYPLRGVSRHQDRQDMGSAITTAEHNEDFGMIYEIGANSVRLSHYPQASYFYDLCDRYGIVVWAEIPFVDQVGTASDFYEVTENQLVEMIRQQYNRPSICFWGLQNEVGNGGKNTTGMAGIMTKLNNKAHEEDPSRLTTQATNGNSSWDSDLIAWNTYPGWYGGTASGLGTTMDSHKSHKNPIAISEYGAGGNVLHHEIPASQPTTTGPWHPEEYQTLVHEEAIKAISTRDYLWATYVWNMFEFASDWRAEGEVPGINDKGLVTYDRKTKKDSFYLYKANWNKHDIFTYVASRRYTPREDDVIPSQKVYSNCDSVELRVNGVSLGEMNNLGYGIFELENVSLKAGENVIEAVGTKGGKTYIDTVTIERTKGSQAKLTSDELYVDNEAKTIGLTRNVTAQELPQILRGMTGATWKLTEEDGTTPVTSGIIVPGMKVHVTAEDESEEAVYVFTAIHISANKPVTVSSAESANPGANAVDFDDSTRWAANTSGGDQWIYVDLQDEYYLNQICVDWYNNSSSLRSYQYRIEVSSDAQNWTTAIDRTNNTQQGRVTDGFISGTKGRYVRIYVTGCDKGNASIYEIIINGWSLESSAYDIDHENRIINVPTPENGEFILLDSFLANLEIKGDCTSTLDASSYFMTNGDKLILSDSAGNQVVYVVDLADGIPIEDTQFFSARRKARRAAERIHTRQM